MTLSAPQSFCVLFDIALTLLMLSDAEDDRVEGSLAIRFIIGLDFAVTLSSPDSFCVLFDITSELCRTEMANVKQTQKMIPFITCEISFGQYVSDLVVGVNVFDLEFGVQIDSIK